MQHSTGRAYLIVLAVNALAVVRAQDIGLEALAVLLEAAALLAVAPLVVASIWVHRVLPHLHASNALHKHAGRIKMCR